MGLIKGFELLTLSSLLVLAACSPNKNLSKVATGEESAGILQGQVVGADEKDFSSTVAIIGTIYDADKKPESQFGCTGTLLKKNVVITAAHCVPTQQDGKILTLIVGFTRDTNTFVQADWRQVVKVYVNPKYNKGQNDMSLIQFQGSTPAGYKVGKVLTDLTQLQKDKTVTLAGFGWTDAQKQTSDGLLRKVDVKILEVDGGLVAVDQSGGIGACHGDSGGPALITVNGIDYVWGVTSWGTGKNGKNDCSDFSVYGVIAAQAQFVTDGMAYLNSKEPPTASPTTPVAAK